jgi:hypothetical protein
MHDDRQRSELDVEFCESVSDLHRVSFQLANLPLHCMFDVVLPLVQAGALIVRGGKSSADTQLGLV